MPFCPRFCPRLGQSVEHLLHRQGVMAKKIWVDDVRGLLKREHGRGWGIEEQSGRVKLYRRVPGDRKQAVTTDLAWAPGSQSDVVQLVATVRNRMEQLGLGLNEAYTLLHRSSDAGFNGVNWSEVATQYEAHRIRTGVKQSTYNAEERYRIDRSVQLLLAPKRAPHDGRGLLKAYSTQYLDQLPSGSPGRKRNLLDVARFLSFAVKTCGAPIKWLPGDVRVLAALVGIREVAPKATVPVKPEQLLQLLESLDANPELGLAVAIVGLYGLRPAELMALRVEEGYLYVAPVKRNKATANKPKQNRLVLPLDLKELPGEGARVLQLYASGLVKLPTSIRNATDFKACGAAFRQYLDRHPCWQSLVAVTPDLVPYSLRHGYAWRGVKYYERSMPMRDLAALMGHDVRTHMRHYGSWTDDKGLKESALQVAGDFMAVPSNVPSG